MSEGLPSLILQLLARRSELHTICPSEVARAAAGASHDWRAQMQPVRDAARELARQGRIRVLQRGIALDAERPWRGPVRLARGPRFGDT